MERKTSLAVPDFSNTQYAFQYLDNESLYRAYILFSAIDQPFLAKWGPRLLQWAFEYSLPVVSVVRKTLFAQFCGGETLEEANAVVELLKRFHVGTVLDYAAESTPNEQGREEGCQQLLASLPVLKKYDQQFAVFKPTSIMSASVLRKLSAGKTLSPREKSDLSKGEERALRIASAAAELGLSVLVDAEESWVQDAIDAWVLGLMRAFNGKRAVIYHTVQLYRKDRLGYLKGLVEQAEKEKFHLGVKLLRGAYLDKENRRAKRLAYSSPIQATKTACDHDFNASLEFCLAHLAHVAIFVGTHNEVSTQHLVRLICQHAGLQKNDPRVAFSQLYGMRDNLTFNLASAGFRALKYVPFGPVKAAIPYLIRRAQENVSIQGQMGRELALIKSEMTRRKTAS